MSKLDTTVTSHRSIGQVYKELSIHADFVKEEPKNENESKMLFKIARNIHELWRVNFNKARDIYSTDEPKRKIIYLSEGRETDINVPFDELCDEEKISYFAHATEALSAVKTFPDDDNMASEVLQIAWTLRNKKSFDQTVFQPFSLMDNDHDHKNTLLQVLDIVKIEYSNSTDSIGMCHQYR